MRRLVLVSRNYLGSINHSLMTAEICRQQGLDVAGWVFNDQYMDYEQEIARWSGYPALFSVPVSIRYQKKPLPKWQALRIRMLKASDPVLRRGMGYLYESL